MKEMSIIGVIWFFLGFISIVSLVADHPLAAAGWGILVSLYAIPYAIVMYINWRKVGKSKISKLEDLEKLSSLHKDGTLSDDEYTGMKNEILGK